VLSQRVWPRAEVAVNIDTRVLSILAPKHGLQELSLEGCTLHHSRVVHGLLGVRSRKKNTQLLLSGPREPVCQLFSQILAATEGIQRRASRAADEKYRYLDGVLSRRQRRSLLRSSAEAEPGAERLGRLPAGDAARLTGEQRAICEAALRGESLFFTGGAGTGKSFLLHQLLKALDPAGTAVTAPTALAASHLGGTTVHRWAGIGRGDADVATLARELQGKRSALSRWRLTRTLVIDEISMLDGELFSKLDALACAVRGSDRPFGGLQLVLAGDFLQLPPVRREQDGEPGSSATLCFQVGAWRAVTRMFELRKVFRQEGDAEFCGLLEEVRFGSLSEKSLQLLRPCLVAAVSSHGAATTRLLPRRAEVERVNASALDALPGPRARFEARDDGSPEELDHLTGARRVIDLSEGALVVLTRTIDVSRKLVNGTQGRVVGFVGAGHLRQPVVAFGGAVNREIPVPPCAFEARCGSLVLGVRVQLPLELAWAVSIHKCQGMTLASVEVSLEKIFEHGQAYVALSRARTLEDVRVVGSEDDVRHSVHADPRCVAFHRKLSAAVDAAVEARRAAEAPAAAGGPPGPEEPESD